MRMNARFEIGPRESFYGPSGHPKMDQDIVMVCWIEGDDGQPWLIAQRYAGDRWVVNGGFAGQGGLPSDVEACLAQEGVAA